MPQYAENASASPAAQLDRDMPAGSNYSGIALRTAGETSDIALGALVRAYRDAASISLEQAAEACALSLTDYRRYEAGERRLTSRELFNLAAALQVPLAKFFQST